MAHSQHSKIEVLSEQVKNLIAAGEVVERPASVVKELVENAIDAGATASDITVEGGGRTLVSVSDDGMGMAPEDAVRSLERHATSKLRFARDLKHIGTLGFRGEALPAIASVSELTLITRPRPAEEGSREEEATEIHVRYGKADARKDAARAPGTSLTVRNLFAMTPARAKFLKSKVTELRWITQVFTAYAMAYPEISFSLTVDGRKPTRYPKAQDRAERIEDVLGTGHRWIHLGPEEETVRLEGLICEPDAGRSSPGHIFFFVNRRWVTSRPLMQALLRAYSPFVARGRYPTAVVYIDVAPDRVDVNVHPTKREVRFREPSKVYNSLFHATEDRLRALRRGRFEITPTPTSASSGEAREERLPYGTATPPSQIEVAIADLQNPPVPVASAEDAEGPRLVTVLGRTYLVAVDEEDLVLVDQHAAHERVLYEEALQALRGASRSRQSLLLPLTLDLTPDEEHTLEQYRDEISSLGFDISAFGGRSVLLEAIPSGIHRWDNGQVLRDILDEMAGGHDAPEDRISRIAASFACHTSVRAGDLLEPAEQRALLGRLFACRDWHQCPHGRPTVVRITRAEIEKRFKRP